MRECNFYSKGKYTAKGSGEIEGYASVFGGIDSYGDTIDPTAYDNVLKSEQLPLMFYQHDRWEVPIGKWEELSVDETGLKVRGKLNLELQQAKDVFSALKFGSITGMSIGFRVMDGDIEFDDAGICHIKNVSELMEISIVNFPADKNARILNVKGEDIELLQNITDCEKYLRDLGVSKRMAQKFISVVKARPDDVSDLQDREKARLDSELHEIQKILDSILKGKNHVRT